ncbi:MAG: cytochrome c3 family protein [Chromatiales bacterium]|nr:cytochrome c3 family protein [Chromatiales bacterium]
MSRKTLWWSGWGLASLALAAWLAYAMLEPTAQTAYMPGPLSDGHHQFADACHLCHTERFGGGEVLQQACIDCHGADRKKPQDSHPRTKFEDPRNADRLERIDALHCTTCHVEHRPEITARDGLTRPVDVCATCHEDIAEDRPSHAGLGFETCKDSGCHNFHDNRDLYTRFLTKHLDEPAMLDEQVRPALEFAALVPELSDYPHKAYPVRLLTESEMDAPAESVGDATLRAQWLASSHANAGVNCSACHVYAPSQDQAAVWHERPDRNGCKACHAVEIGGHGAGKHGMRLAHGLDPMKPTAARLPMQADAADLKLDCVACHGAHDFDTRHAQVEACLGCHADEHSLAYRKSKHFESWQAELAGDGPSGSGVSCAACHMPRVDVAVNEWMSRVGVQHNQSANLSPNSKMLRSACLNCHGLEFSLGSLADGKLITNNFQGRPQGVHETMRLARAEKERADAKAAAGGDDGEMFGF